MWLTCAEQVISAKDIYLPLTGSFSGFRVVGTFSDGSRLDADDVGSALETSAASTAGDLASAGGCGAEDEVKVECVMRVPSDASPQALKRRELMIG